MADFPILLIALLLVVVALAALAWWRARSRSRLRELARRTAEQALLAEAEAARRRQADDEARQHREAAAAHKAAHEAAQEAARASARRAAIEAQRLRDEARAAAQRKAAEAHAEAQRRAAADAARLAAEQQTLLQAARAAPRPAAPPAPVPPPPPPPLPHDTLVMVADDSKVVRVKTSRLLQQHQYRVVLAEDGQQAADLIERETPAVLITDVEMPGLDGFALTRHVRAHRHAARIPIIMITSADDRLKVAAAAAGVTLVLGKPYAEQALIDGIEQARRAANAAPLPA